MELCQTKISVLYMVILSLMLYRSVMKLWGWNSTELALNFVEL